MTSVHAEKITYVSFSELKEQAKEGWHKQYHIKDWNINVDIDNINIVTETMPDKITIPIVTAQGVSDLSNIPHTSVLFNDPDGLSYDFITNYPENFFRDGTSAFDYFEKDVVQAENNPLSMEMADVISQKILSDFISQFPDTSLKLDESYASSKRYHVNNQTEQLLPDYNKPFSSLGDYLLSYVQCFYGIPCLNGHYNMFSCIDNGQNLPFGVVRTEITSESDYTVSAFLAKPLGILYDDVPLASFSNLLHALDDMMEKGSIYRITKLEFRLCFANNPEDMGNSYLLIPAWIIYGNGVQYPDLPFPDIEEEHNNARIRFMLHAQTLTLYGEEMPSLKEKTEVPLIGWNDVQ